MVIYNVFPTAVAKFELGRSFNLKELTFVASQPTYKNMGNTTSSNRYVLRDKSMSCIQKFVQESVDKYLQSIYAPKHNVRLKITQSWLNYTDSGGFHHKHEHPNSFISGVLYLKADKTKDKIHFYRSSYQQIKLPTENWNLHNSDSWWFEVNMGELLLFPSNLTHAVETVQGGERVSLAFNTFPVGYIGEEENLTALHLE